VSVVVPPHDASRTLGCTLASLAAQTYPRHLLEVVVVDDGSDPPLSPASLADLVGAELLPERLRVVTTRESWGRAHACHVGALAAEGEVLHWLDADMVLHRREVEAQLRWHHLLDHAAVLGTKTFVDEADGWPDPRLVHDLVRDDRAAELFAGRWTAPHDWVEEFIERHERLTTNPTMSFLVHVGASASVRRELYLDAGGMDPTLKLGEDIELGYRLSAQGAVFVPDPDATAWHLGRSTLMQQQETVNRYNRPFITDRVPSLRKWRARGRSYTVPWVEAVVEADGQAFEDVRHSVNGFLGGSVPDVSVLVVGPWSRLTDQRRRPLDDEDQALRLLHAELAGDARVRFVEEVPGTAAPATYRLLLPAGWSPGRDSVRRLGNEMARRDRGLVSVLMPDGKVARLERTSAFARARRLTADPAELDAVVDDVSRTWWYDGVEEGFTSLADLEAGPAAEDSPEPVPDTAPAAAVEAPPPGRARGRGAPRQGGLRALRRLRPGG
jgi:GT2 family glycosyltransferase